MKKINSKKQLIFNIISIVSVFILILIYGARFIYYKMDSEKKITYSKVLYERLIQLNDNSKLTNFLTEINDVKYFTNNSNNNYIKYKDFVWRIIKINKDNSLTLIMEEPLINISHNNIIDWLNKSDTEYSGIFENNLNKTKLMVNNETCNDEINDINNLTCTNIDNSKISILSINDYIATGADKSFINNGTEFWLINKYKENDYIYINDNGDITNDNIYNKHSIRPVITINKDTKIIKGNGTIDNPYIIEKQDIETLSDTNIGTYVSFNNTTWKIVSKIEDKIKIVNTECIKDEDNICIKKYFDKEDNEISRYQKLIDYLNDDYYETLSNKDYIIKGPFYIGKYSLIDNDYTTIFKESINLRVGLLSIGEPYSFEQKNTFTLSTPNNNTLTIYTINNENKLYEDSITTELNIYPSVYLKENLNITDGKGTYIEPYILGEKDEKERKKENN